MENGIEFNKERIATMQKISKELVSDPSFALGTENDDFIKDEMTLKLTGYIYSNMADVRTLTYYCDRPKFLDWLLRRSKRVQWELKVKDLLLNPPKLKDRTTRIYIADQIENE